MKWLIDEFLGGSFKEAIFTILGGLFVFVLFGIPLTFIISAADDISFWQALWRVVFGVAISGGLFLWFAWSVRMGPEDPKKAGRLLKEYGVSLSVDNDTLVVHRYPESHRFKRLETEVKVTH